MNNATILIKKMKELQIPEDATRTVRAMFVAQAFAYQIPLTPEATIESLLTQYEREFTNLVSDVNERLQLDIKQAKNLFKRILEGRLAIMNGPISTALLIQALQSDDQSDRLNQEENSAVALMTSLPNFKTIQADVASLLFVENKTTEVVV